MVLGSGAALYAVPGSPGAPGWAVQAMTTIGLVMTLVYAYIVLVPYRRMREAVVASDWPAGGAAMGLIRRLVGLNLALGLFTVAIATLGRGL